MILKKIEEKFETNSFHINLSNYCEKNCYHCFNWSIDKIKKNNILENIENYFEYALLHIKNMNKLLNIKLNEFQFMGESFFYDLSKKEYEYFFEIFDKYTNIFKEFNQRFQYSFHTCLNKPLNKDCSSTGNADSERGTSSSPAAKLTLAFLIPASIALTEWFKVVKLTRALRPPVISSSELPLSVQII